MGKYAGTLYKPRDLASQAADAKADCLGSDRVDSMHISV